MITRRHAWTGQKCRRCGTTKTAVCWVGRGLILWTYLRTDGIRFTGHAPECDSGAEARTK